MASTIVNNIVSMTSLPAWKAPFLSSPAFQRTKAYHNLTKLVPIAPHLNHNEVPTKNRFEQFRAYTAGYTLHYGFERVDSQIMAELSALAKERAVIDQMKAMLEGHPVNWIEGVVSEARPVLHTAMRGVVCSTHIATDAWKKASVEIDVLAHLMTEIEGTKKINTMLFIGIGGSELGPHAIAEALRPYWKPNRKVIYAANVDPDELTHILDSIVLSKTAVVIVSKSGTTLETATNEARVRSQYIQQGLDPAHYFIAVTCPDTPMDSNKDAYLCRLHLFDYVGGRYSTTSMVGGILIAFLTGVAIFKEFLQGAHEVDLSVLSPSLEENIALVCALLGVWNREFLQYPTTAIIPYAAGLHRFPAHLQQCEMESNGKHCLRTGEHISGQKTGAVIWGEPGTNAQHSFFQLIHQGSDVIPVEFIGYKKSQNNSDFVFKGTTSHDKLLANMLAQSLALAQGRKDENPNKYFYGNRPSRILLAEQLTAKALGSLLAIYEHKIAFQGFLWGINSFDQEGVQLGKVLADKFLKAIDVRKKSKDSDEALAALSPLESCLIDMIW